MYKFHHHITNNMTYIHTYIHTYTGTPASGDSQGSQEMKKLHFKEKTSFYMLKQRRKQNKTGSFRQLRWSEPLYITTYSRIGLYTASYMYNITYARCPPPLTHLNLSRSIQRVGAFWYIIHTCLYGSVSSCLQVIVSNVGGPCKTVSHLAHTTYTNTQHQSGTFVIWNMHENSIYAHLFYPLQASHHHRKLFPIVRVLVVMQVLCNIFRG